MFRNGITVSPADGGFIISWAEKREREEPKGFDTDDPMERAMLRPMVAPFVRHEAVRTTIEEALKLVGKVLKENRLAQGDEAMGSFIAGA